MKYAPFPFIEISGSPFRRGEMHGSAFASRVKASVGHYLGQLTDLGYDAAAIRDMVAHFMPVIEEFDPDYAEEMRGIAKGSSVDLEHIVLINARTEVLRYARLAGYRGEAVIDEPDGCTGVVALASACADGRLIHALNWDWKASCIDTAVVIRIRREDGPDLLVFTEAGSLARAGLNEVGTAVTANYIESDRDGNLTGVPLALIRRKILECESFALSMHSAAFTPKVTSNNLILSNSSHFAIDFECAPDESFPLYPENGLLVHANHWLSPVALSKIRDIGITNSPESYYRDWRVRELLTRNLGCLTPELIAEALFDDFGTPWSVCRPPRPSLFTDLSATVAMLVMEPAKGTLNIAPMPALQRTFTQYTLHDTQAESTDPTSEISRAAAESAAYNNV
jgi:isopenicillin-N N-acyltransferase-like protein